MLLQTTSSDLTQVIHTSLTTLEALTNTIVGEELKIYTPPRNNVLELHFDCLRRDEIVYLRLAGDVLHVTGIGRHAEVAEFVVCKFIEEKLNEFEWVQEHDVILDHVVDVDVDHVVDVDVDHVVVLDNIATRAVNCDSVALDNFYQKEVTI